MSFSSKKVIIFDLDGTLVNSMASLERIASIVMSRHFGCKESWARQRYRETSGLPFPFQLKKIFSKDYRWQPAVDDFNKTKRNTYRDFVFYDDVIPNLQRLKEAGFQLAVSSNNDQPLVDDKLKSISYFFNIVLGFRPNFLKGKHHFCQIQNDLHLQKSEMLFIGDSLYDAVMAKENNISFVARLGTFTQDDFNRQGIVKHCLRTFDSLGKFLTKEPQSIQIPA